MSWRPTCNYHDSRYVRLIRELKEARVEEKYSRQRSDGSYGYGRDGRAAPNAHP